MKLRHAAALALVGWYLLALPPEKRSLPPMSVPFSQWVILESFDKAEDCSVRRAKMSESAGFMRGEQIFWLACVATDDPRLREPSK